MSGLVALWRAAAELARDGPPAALATVARRRGSLPMATNAKMVVTATGRRWGTIGGGCLEADVMAQALAALESGEPAVVRHTLNADIAGDLGLSCGGTVELFVEPLPQAAEMSTLLDGVADAIERRCAAAVFTAMDWSAGPRKLMLAGETTHRVGRWPPEWRPSSYPSACAAHVDEESGLFVEPVGRSPRVIIFGAGHVGQEIARAAAGTDFYVSVIDDREEFANEERFPWADEIVVSDLRAFLDQLVIDEDDYVISCTRGHAMDAVIVERTAGSRARYVGMLGSKRKRVVIWKALERAGVPRQALERVKVPIGEAIGADTPGEIGIAVMAELIRIRRSGAVVKRNA
ncbi:MAG: XdhC family protein [Gemmatimonadales bacterium]